MDKKKILITGGNGFIGRNLKEQLSNKYEVFAPAHAELDLLNGGKVGDYLKKHHFDVVVHAATWDATAVSTKDTAKVLENNLRMYFNLAGLSEAYGKMIYFGSGAEYNRVNWLPKMKEEYFDTSVPNDQYGFSKYIMRKWTEKSNNIYNLSLFGVFGKYEQWRTRFISYACCKALYDLPITIKQNVSFDYLYIDDVVKITEWFIINTPAYKTFNVCSGQSNDLVAYAKMVLKAASKKLDIMVDREGMGKEYGGDNSRLLKQIGHFSFKDIEKAIQELYQWYVAHADSIDEKVLKLKQ